MDMRIEKLNATLESLYAQSDFYKKSQSDFIKSHNTNYNSDYSSADYQARLNLLLNRASTEKQVERLNYLKSIKESQVSNKIDACNSEVKYLHASAKKLINEVDASMLFDELTTLTINFNSVLDYIVENNSIVENAIKSMFKYLYLKSLGTVTDTVDWHKITTRNIYYDMFVIESKKHERGENSLFSEWVQEFYKLFLESREVVDGVLLSKYIKSDLTEKQVENLKNRLQVGFFRNVSEFVFKVLSFKIVATIRNKVRKERRMKQRNKHIYCEDNYLQFNKSLYSAESKCFFDFVCSKIKVNKTKKDFLLFLCDNKNNMCFDFISSVATANNISVRTLREKKRTLKNVFIDSDLLIIEKRKARKFKLKFKGFKNLNRKHNAKKMYVRKFDIVTCKYSNTILNQYRRFKAKRNKHLQSDFIKYYFDEVKKIIEKINNHEVITIAENRKLKRFKTKVEKLNEFRDFQKLKDFEKMNNNIKY